MKKGVVFVFVMACMMIGGGCSLFLGPLSRLSMEAVVHQEWEWQWVGEWDFHTISFIHGPRSLKTYREVSEDKPGFLAYFPTDPSGRRYLHLKPNGEAEILMEATSSTYIFDPLHVFVSSDQREVIACGAHVNNIAGNASVFSKNLFTGEYSFFLVDPLLHVSRVEKKVFYHDPTSQHIKWWNFGETSGNSFFSLGMISDFSFLLSEQEDKSLLCVVTNNHDTERDYYLFYDLSRNHQPSMDFSRKMVSFRNVSGVVAKKHPYIMVRHTNASGSGEYTLLGFVSGRWLEMEKRGVVGMDANFLAVDIISVDALLVVAWVIEPQKILIAFYHDVDSGPRRLGERVLSLDRGVIDSVDFFYDREGKRLLLGVLHRIPPNDHVGVSFFTLKLF